MQAVCLTIMIMFHIHVYPQATNCLDILMSR